MKFSLPAFTLSLSPKVRYLLIDMLPIDVSLKEVWQNSLNEARDELSTLMASQSTMDQLCQISDALIQVYKKGGRVFACGNGGSHCDAMHFAEELTGRYRKDRHPLGALALGDPSHITCVSNDFGFEHIFARQLLGLARSGDLLIVITTSGNSKNLIRAAEAAKTLSLPVIGLLGKTGGELAQHCTHKIIAPGKTSDRIQELHIKILHILVETIERSLFPEHYITQ